MTAIPAIGALLFDLDGTLLDTAPDFIFCVNQLRREEGLAPLPHDAIRRHVSNGATALTALVSTEPADSPAFNSLRERLLTFYATHLADQTRLFPGLEVVLERAESARVPWGIVTNKPRRYTEPLLQQLGLASRCATVVCPEDVTHRKPHPEPMLLACRQAACDPVTAIYVGDHRRDIESGRAAGMRTIAAGWGYIEEHDDPVQWQADWLDRSVADFACRVNALLNP